MKKLSSTEAELKKNVTYKKSVWRYIPNQAVLSA